MPLWPAFAQPSIRAAKAGNPIDGLIQPGETFSYAETGFVATEVTLPTDQLGTQMDPPAHWNDMGATISDVPPTVTLRPLIVIDVRKSDDPTYHASAADVLRWEATHGRVPEGSVVFFRSDWSKRWAEYGPVAPEAFPGVGLDALKLLHNERRILMHGHEPLDTSMSPTGAEEAWLMHNDFLQVEGAANLHLVPPTGAYISIGFAKIEGGTGGYARLIAICPPDWPHGVTIDEAPGAPLPRQSGPLRRGTDGVMRATPGATPTLYCAPGSTALGCPPAK